MLARALRTVVAFSVIVAALAHALVTLLGPFKLGFFRDNLLTASQRAPMLALSLGALVAAGLFALVVVARDPARSVPSLEWWVRVACPALVAPLLVALLHHDMGTEAEQALLLVVLVVGFERLLRISLQAWDEPPVAPSAAPSRLTRALGLPRVWAQRFFASPGAALITVVVLASWHAIFLATWAVWSHQRFTTYGFDLGQYDSVFASTLHGRWLAMPALGLTQNWGDLTSNHADLAVFYLLPIYALRPGATTLLIMQSTFVAAAAVPVYLFAKSRLSTPVAFAMAIAWLLYAPLHEAQLYDYHPQLIAAPLVLCAFAAVEYRRWTLYWVFFALAILCREDVSIGLAALGLYLALSGHRVKTGIATTLIACGYFLLLRFFLMTNTAFSGIYKDLLAPDEPGGFGSILKTLISNPAFALKSLLTWEKVRYVAQVFAPLAFLPMRRGLLWVLMIPGLFLTLLSTQYLPTIQISFQYVANWSVMFPAAAIAMGAWAGTRAGQRQQWAAICAVLLASVVATVQWGAYSPRGSLHGGFVEVPLQRPSAEDRKRERDVQDLLQKVPAEVPLCTSDRVQPHTTAAHIENLPLKSGVFECEYLMWLPGDMGSEHAAAALSRGTYQLVEQRSGVSLAKKKPKPVEPAAAPAAGNPAGNSPENSP